MLPDQYRLKKKSDFDILFKEGRFLNSERFTLKIWNIDPAQYPKRGYKADDFKIGFVVGKKVHKNAVERNRIRRQMREVVRLFLKESRIRQGFMVALVAKPTMFGSSYQEIEQEIVELLKRARVLV